MKKWVKNFIYLITRYTYWIILLLQNIRYLCFASSYVIVFRRPGFGHSIAGCEVARRVLKKPICYIILADRSSEYNLKVSLIFSDIYLLFLPLDFISLFSKTVCFNCGVSIEQLEQQARSFVNFVLKLLNVPSEAIFSQEDVYNKIKIAPEIISENSLCLRDNSTAGKFLGYFDLLQNIKVLPLNLPFSISSSIKHRLSSLAPNAKKLCCLYLRNENNIHISGWIRNGSEVQVYYDAIEKLIAEKYQVLLIGDRDCEIEDSFLEKHNGMILNAKLARTQTWIFSLYAGLESDIFIGDSGGACFLPISKNIPCLLLNAMPIGFGLPNSYVLYKTFRTKEGTLLPVQTLFEKYSYNYELSEITISNNTKEETLDAVSHFLSSLNVALADPNQHLYSYMPLGTWFRQAKSKICPMWKNLSVSA